MQANVGPTMLPGKGLSETPPDHRSTSEGCLWGYRKWCYKFKFFKYSTLVETLLGVQLGFVAAVSIALILGLTDPI
jgi:hypothetical protein